MTTIVIFAVLAAVVALIVGFTAGKDRYAAMSEEEFEAEAKRASLLGAAVMGLQKVLAPKRVECIMQRDNRVEGDSAEASDPPAGRAPCPLTRSTTFLSRPRCTLRWRRTPAERAVLPCRNSCN